MLITNKNLGRKRNEDLFKTCRDASEFTNLKELTIKSWKVDKEDKQVNTYVEMKRAEVW